MTASIQSVIGNHQVGAVLCAFHGDSAKGKVVDAITPYYDVIVRCTGGNNAGHTVFVDGVKHVSHLLTSGITHPGKINILGPGTVIDVFALNEEIYTVAADGELPSTLYLSSDAQVVMPYHIIVDKAMAQAKIGTTGRGIGPCYEDHVGRRGIMMRDIGDADELSDKIDEALRNMPAGVDFSDFHKDDEISRLLEAHSKLGRYIRDTNKEVMDAYKAGIRILLEGAQGFLLDYKFGTYPFVTSSSPSRDGTAMGAGLPSRAVGIALNVVKVPVSTRVGNGPLPTEIGGRDAEEYASVDGGTLHTLKSELDDKGIPYAEENGNFRYDHHHPIIHSLMNSPDGVEQSVGYRLAGEEFGASTGRPRRVCFADCEALRYAFDYNGNDVVITKPDIVRGADFVQIAKGYKNGGFTRDSKALAERIPDYETLPGFDEDISDVREFSNLPANLQHMLDQFAKYTRANIRMVSTGSDREQLFVKG